MERPDFVISKFSDFLQSRVTGMLTAVKEELDSGPPSDLPFKI
ncbi:hypothetical protein [Marinobacter sp.]|nr:hypothetical protein [Marinobacter sp.]